MRILLRWCRQNSGICTVRSRSPEKAGRPCAQLFSSFFDSSSVQIDRVIALVQPLPGRTQTSSSRIIYVATDTKRFEGIDSEFKELMKEAINVPMAVDACGVDGRAEGLKSMMQRLEMCQKSLNEYLDMKKKVIRGGWLKNSANAVVNSSLEARLPSSYIRKILSHTGEVTVMKRNVQMTAHLYPIRSFDVARNFHRFSRDSTLCPTSRFWTCLPTAPTRRRSCHTSAIAMIRWQILRSLLSRTEQHLQRL